MGTNFAPLLADIFLNPYEAEFIQFLLSVWKKLLASQLNFTYRYIVDVLSINNPDFENYLGQIYPAELEIKDTTKSITSASYLDLLLSVRRDGQLRTFHYEKRDDFNFHITNLHTWVAICHLRQPLVCLSLSSYGMPGLAHLRMFYSESGATFM